MDTVKRKQAVLYIEANRLFFYPGPAGNTVQLAFPQDMVSDLEVLNPQKFLNLFLVFFQTQKIPPSEILCVFAQATVFEKEFPLGEKKESVQQFLDYVPFDDILSKQFTINKKLRVFAINGQLYNIVKQASEKSNCVSVAVVAYTSLLEIIPELSQKVDLPLMLSRFDSCRQFSLETNVPQQTILPDKMPPKKQNKRLYLLLGVFGVLIAILVAMVFSTFHTPNTPPTTNTPRSLPVTSLTTPTIVPSLPIVHSSASALPQK